MKFPVRTLLCGLACSLLCEPAFADGGPPAVGSVALLATFFHGVRGTATVLDPQTVQVEHFYYDGGGPVVYFYLGTNDSQGAFVSGIPIGDVLIGRYSNAKVTLSLPEGQSLEGYNAISVWCVQFQIDFGSGTFMPPSGPQLTSVQNTNRVTSVVVSGTIGESYELQVSSNLSIWTDLESKTNTEGTVTFTDTNQFIQRFYRVMLVP